MLDDKKANLALIPVHFHTAIKNFNPMTIVIKILSRSKESSRREVEQLNTFFELVDGYMNTFIDLYYKGFNRSIRNFSQILQIMTDAKHNIQDIGKEVAVTKNLLSSSTLDVRNLWLKLVDIKERLRILEMVESIKVVPARLERLIRHKYFLSATSLLLTSTEELSHVPLVRVHALKGIIFYFAFRRMQTAKMLFNNDK